MGVQTDLTSGFEPSGVRRRATADVLSSSDKLFLAVDVGASNGRHILGRLEDGCIRLEEVHRFANGMKHIEGHLCWDVDELFSEILTGLRKCAQLGKTPVSVGIDTWGCDFILLDSNGSRVGPAVAYRDSRTDGIDADVSKLITEPELYARTGIQRQLFNTIYQLMALKTKTPHILEKAARFLMMPDYLHYRLSGVMKTEYTDATTTGLVNAASKNWDDEVIARCGFPRKLFGEIVPAGTALGGLAEDVRQSVGFDCTVFLPPTHDTASAFLAVPAKSDSAVYISSGTWSLMGVELTEPITSEASRAANLTNEGGYEYRFRFLKNIMGLWILQSVHKEIGGGLSFPELTALAEASDCDCIFDVNEECFFSPDSMVETVRKACRDIPANGAKGKPPQSPGDFARCILRSLASSYAQTALELQSLTGKSFSSINIIGGGSENGFLNKMTAIACGLPVYAGPAEGTALGNIASQMIGHGILPSLEEARKIINRSFNIREVLPY